MSTTTYTKVARTILPVGTVCATAGYQRAALDVKSGMGGTVTVKIINGTTGPTAPCVATAYIAHNSSTPAIPTTPSASNADWKFANTICGGGVTANAVTEQTYDVAPGVMQLLIDFTGNTAQPVTVEAFMTEVASAVTVA